MCVCLLVAAEHLLYQSVMAMYRCPGCICAWVGCVCLSVCVDLSEAVFQFVVVASVWLV